MRLFWLEGTLRGVKCDLLFETGLTPSSDRVCSGLCLAGFRTSTKAEALQPLWATCLGGQLSYSDFSSWAVSQRHWEVRARCSWSLLAAKWVQLPLTYLLEHVLQPLTVCSLASAVPCLVPAQCRDVGHLYLLGMYSVCRTLTEWLCI